MYFAALPLLWSMARLLDQTDICTEWHNLSGEYGHKLSNGCSVQATSPSHLHNRFIIVYENTGQVNNKVLTLEKAPEEKKDINITSVYNDCMYGFSATLSARGLRELVTDSRVKFVEQDQIVTSVVLQRDPIWNLDRIDQRDNLLNQLYDTGSSDGKGVHVYVLDTGINEHDDYAGRLGNGANFIGDTNSWSDCNGHGTHCAGTVGGTRWGVAKKATLHAVRILGCSGSGTSSSVLNGIDWVMKQRTRNGWPTVASMSLGSGKSGTINRAIARAVEAGVVVVAAAGNEDADACNSSPASAASAITVGSTTINDQRSSFSNYGQCVDIFAPGSNIRSASYRSRTGSSVLSGTSMACPHVAGAVAIIMGENTRADPASVTRTLLNSATRGLINNPRGKNVFLRTLYGSGLPLPTPQPGQCVTVGGPKTNQPCQFPFVFQSRSYTSCTTVSDPDGRFWCSTLTRSGTHVQGNWGYCPNDCAQSSAPTKRPTPQPSSSPTAPTLKPTKKTAQPTPRFRPTSQPTSVIPSPVPRDCKTIDGTDCIIPFVFGRKTYRSCTADGDETGKKWCSTKTDQTGRHVRGNWGYCRGQCLGTIVPPEEPATPSPVECEILALINELRRGKGLSRLVLDKRLQRAAIKHSMDMEKRNFFSHVNPDGLGADERVLGEGYAWRSVAENIAVGYSTATEVVRGWKNSPGHYRNIMCESCTETGVGVYYLSGSKWTYYYTQVFGSADGPPVKAGPCQAVATDGRSCKTVGGPAAFKSCDFPFSMNGVKHYSCLRFPQATQSWCPTNSDLFEKDPHGTDVWGFCANECPSKLVACKPSQWWCIPEAGGLGMVSESGARMAISLPNLTIDDYEATYLASSDCYHTSSSQSPKKTSSLTVGLGIGLPTLLLAVLVIHFRFGICKKKAEAE